MTLKKWVWKETAETIGVLGVIASLIFVAFEIRQNNEALGLQARLERESVVRNGIRDRFRNPELVRATARVLRDEPLSLEEEIMLLDANRGTLMDWRFAYRQAEDGFIEIESIPVGSWRLYFHEQSALMQRSWAEFRRATPPEDEFVAWVEANVVKMPLQPPASGP